MTADLGLVTHAAQCHAHIFAAGGLGNRLAQRGLAHAGWPDQAQDRRFNFVHALLHREIFQNSVFDLVQTKVVLIQHVFGVGQIVLELGLFAPWQADEHVQVVAHHGGLSRHGRHEFELLEFALGLFTGLNRHLGGLDLLFDFLDVRALFAIAQFFLDGLDLLVQVEVALVFLHLAFDAATDALVHIQDIDLVLQLGKQVFQAQLDVGQVQHLLLVLQFERQVGRDRVGQTAGVIDAGDRSQDLRGDFFVEFDVLVKLLHHGSSQGFDFTAGFRLLSDRVNRVDRGHKVNFPIHDGLDQRTLLAFNQHFHRAIRQLQHLQDGGDTTHVEHVLDAWFVLGGGLLGHQHDAALSGHRGLKRLDALWTPHKQGNHHVREHHHIAQRQHGQFDQGGRQRCVSRHGVSLRSIQLHMDPATEISTHGLERA